MSLLDSLAATLHQEPEQVASRLGLHLDEVPPGQGVDDEKVAEAVMANAARVQELQAVPPSGISVTVANALGVEPDADETKVGAAIIRLKAPGAGLAAVRTKLGLPDDAGEAAICNAIGELRAVRRKGEAEDLVDGAVAEGRIPPAHRGFYLNEAERDLEAAREVINSLPVVTGRSGLDRRSAHRPGPALSATEQVVCDQLGLTEQTFLAARDD